MIVKHKRQNSYRGDNNILIYVEDEKGNKIGMFNIFKTEYGYDNDRFGRVFKTIKHAKEFVKKNIDSLLETDRI